MATPTILIENAVEKASQAMDKDPKLTGVAAAHQYSAIYSRLMVRRWGRPPSSTRGGHNKKLPVPQNQALKDYLLMLYHAGTSATLQEVVVASN